MKMHELELLEEERLVALEQERAAQRQCYLSPSDATCLADLRASRDERQRIEDRIAGLREQQLIEQMEQAERDRAGDRKRREQAHSAAYTKFEERDRKALRVDSAMKALQAETDGFEAIEVEIIAELRDYPEIVRPVREALRQDGFRSLRQVVTAELTKAHVIVPGMEFLEACSIVEQRGHLELSKARGRDARAKVDRILALTEEETPESAPLS